MNTLLSEFPFSECAKFGDLTLLPWREGLENVQRFKTQGQSYCSAH